MIKEKTQKKPVHIFLSYDVVDTAYADQLKVVLTKHPNVHIFTTKLLSAGEEWRTKLKIELSKCDVFMVLLSPDSVSSKWVLHELGAAWGIDKPIIPVVTHPEVFSKIPVQISHLQAVEMSDTQKPEIIDQLLKRYEVISS